MKCFFALTLLSVHVSLCYGTNEWAVVIEGGLETANRIAQDNGFTCIGQIGNLANHYRFRREHVESHYDDQFEINLKNHDKVSNVLAQTRYKRALKRYTIPRDPKWHNQWSLNNTGQTNETAGLDLNIEKAWLQDLSGDGVIVGVVDNGVQWNVADIEENYDSSASYDFVNNDPDPSPDPYDEGASHGTSCAGEIAMRKNDVCGVGVAYESKIAGLRIGIGSLVGITDAEEADALGHMHQDIAIYSNSWGPPDDGFSFAGPGTLVTDTLRTGSIVGRDGKGSVYVWASGNGGVYDSCAADGFVNSIYTIAIGSADERGEQAFYDESCSAKMAVTYSLDSKHYDNEDKSHQLVTIDLSGQCTDNFTGSSASAPLVSATIALVLERNPDLTWRDIQYLIAYTSDSTKLNAHGGWTVNGGGLNVSSEFGFGAIDAEAMVTRAQHWTNVPEDDRFVVVINNVDEIIQASGDYTIQFNTSSDFLFIQYTEHVLVTLNIQMITTVGEKVRITDNCDVPLEPFKAHVHLNKINEDFNPCVFAELWTNRAGITITMTSPAGTESVLLPSRPCDICQNGLASWSFMSVHHWGENPMGTWNVKISFDDPSNSNDAYLVVSGEQTLDIRGVDEIPVSVQQIPTTCDPACVRGCAASGSEFCDSCRRYRDPVTLECLDSCNKTIYNGYCLDYNPLTSDEQSSLSTSDVVGIVIGLIGGCVLIAFVVLIIVIVKKKYRKQKEYVNIDDTPSA